MHVLKFNLSLTPYRPSIQTLLSLEMLKLTKFWRLNPMLIRTWIKSRH